jgi:hypothetical protein
LFVLSQIDVSGLNGGVVSHYGDIIEFDGGFGGGSV